jgi:hypothetical protein
MTAYNITIVANAGRSGSTYLFSAMREQLGNRIYLAHEDIPIQISKPRHLNRAYNDSQIDELCSDRELLKYIRKWQYELERRDVVETGWTCYHLLPFLKHVFGDQLQVAILHREPWTVAMSRANMGNYHPQTWYDDAHEVSPFDKRAIAPEYLESWPSMNHVEKCLYWWFVIYREIFEFLAISQTTPRTILSADQLFHGDGLLQIGSFIGHALVSPSNDATEKNPVNRFMSETFPVRYDEIKPLEKHSGILEFAQEKFGYVYNSEIVAKQAEKYALPKNWLSVIRHKTGFWARRRTIGRLIRGQL